MDVQTDDDAYLSGSEADLDSGSESDSVNSLDQQLNGIGSFAMLRMPSFSWPTSRKEPDVALETLSRREQLANLIDDLKSGFSLQSALDRFQTIRTILESQVDEAIANNVDTTDDEQQDEAEPYVIHKATEPKETHLLDQVIILQDKIPKRRKRRHTLKDNNLTKLTEGQKKDETLLRDRIMQIRGLDATDEVKNRLVQKLMMGAHYDKVKFLDENGDEIFHINTKTASKRSEDVGSEHYDADDGDEHDDDDLVLINEDDKEPTFHDDNEETFGCAHYQRHCKMECPTCKQWFTCPKCHDEQVPTHKFKREKTRHVMCMHCSTVQHPSQFCEACDVQFAHYFCDKCKLYDDDELKDIYHCDDCGICRLGLGLGQDFFHCQGCNACLSIELQDDHKCIERATQSDCPICGEYMFTSTRPVVFMLCGHAIHQSCFDEHSKHSYKCPSCQKTVLNMEAQFRVLDMEISLQPLPEPYCNWTCVITCNDCNAKSQCRYHVLGLKCDNCKSYNTVQQKLVKPEESDYESDISTTTNRLRQALPMRNLRNLPISSHLLGTNFAIENVASGDESPTHEDRVLTIPQQFLSNFDSYINNMEDSSDDEEDDDDVDFLRVNRAMKDRRKKLETFGANIETHTSIDNDGMGAGIATAVKDFLKNTRVGQLIDEAYDDNEMTDDELMINGF